MTEQRQREARSDPRAEPDEALITKIRGRYPVERELDRVLTRKMRLRSSPGYRALPLEDLAQGTASLIRSEIGDDFALLNPRWLQGGASKLQMAFDLDWQPPGARDRQVTRMVLRMEPPASIVETSRAREFEVLQLVKDAVPVPPCFWVDIEGSHLPFPALIYGFVEGTTKPTARISQTVSGIGTNFGPELRAVLAEQFVANLVAVHTIDEARLAQLQHFDAAEVGSNSAIIRQINGWRRIWEEDRFEDSPLIEVIAEWLIENAPTLDRVSLVHGDFRTGNFLFSETSEKITAWLDWELAALGDRHQDLSWVTGSHFGHYAEDGKTFLACGLMPVDEFLPRYEQLSGLTVDPKKLQFFRIFNDFQGVVTMLGAAWRVARHGKTHQDVVVAWLSMLGQVILGNLRDRLEELL
ncbi:phosphotransferase family protein [Sphingobium phenoxybenzoativorans]|nr:phosphotransferase family protein [Sphingobium phenoxybenzoativorans]